MAADERMAIADQSAKRSPGRRCSRVSAPSPGQLSLFDVPLQQAPAANDAGAAAPEKPVAAKAEKRRPSRRVVDMPATYVLSVSDMPAYADEAHESVAKAIKLLPQAQLWFTYKDIQFFFGVSRATVARRLRDGLVPGVRMAGASVVEDSAVRRFDREQLKWLLLALRHRRRQLAP